MTTVNASFTGTTAASATAALPVDVTCGSHPFNTGDVVLFSAFDEMTELNGNYFNVESLDANSLGLRGVGPGLTPIDGSGFTAETTGGIASLGLSSILSVKEEGEEVTITLTGGATATLALDREAGTGSEVWKELRRWTGNVVYQFKTQQRDQRYRLRLISWTSGTITAVLADAARSVPLEELLTATEDGLTIAGTLTVDGVSTLTGDVTSGDIIAGDLTADTVASLGAISDGAASTFASGAQIGNLTLGDGSIVDSSGAIYFGNEALTTTGLQTANGLATTQNTGTSAATSVVEKGDGHRHTTILTITGLSLPAIGDNVSKAVGDLIYTFPGGAIILESVYANIIVAPAGAENDAVVADVGIGSTIATGAVALLDGTPGFEDMLTGFNVTLDDATASVSAGQSTAGGPMFIASGDDHTVHVNVAAAWADSAAQTCTYTGVVVLNWIFEE